MSRMKVTSCPPRVMIIAAIVAASGLFLIVADLAEQPRGARMGLEALLIIPLLLCSMQAARMKRS